MTGPVIVADFATGDSAFSARELVAAAVARGAGFVAVDVSEADDRTPDAHLGERRIGPLARVAAEAEKKGVGLFIRLRDTLSIDGLATALSAPKGSDVASLRDRLLVVVRNDRVGKRLRREAPQMPSAYEVFPGGTRGLLRFAPPNYQRAAADADDLVLPWTRPGAASVSAALARRGARLWLTGLGEADVLAAAELDAAGLVVRF